MSSYSTSVLGEFWLVCFLPVFYLYSMNRYSLSLNFAFTLKVRLFLFFSKVHTSYSYNYILSCKETYPQPQFSIVGQCFTLLKQLQDGGTQIPLPKVCLDYRLNGQSFYLFVFLSCVFLWVFFQQTKKYILNLKALVNLGITCSETLTNFYCMQIQWNLRLHKCQTVKIGACRIMQRLQHPDFVYSWIYHTK